MSAYEWTLLVLLGVFGLAVAAMVLAVRRRARWQECRYRIFALRDDMVRCVAQGDVESENLVYAQTVWFMNTLIRDMPNFTVSELAKGILWADETADEQVSWDDYDAALKEAKPEVARVVERFWATVVHILVHNSPSLRAYIWLHKHARSVAELMAGLLRRVGKPPTWRAYKVSEQHRRALTGDANMAHA